MPAIRNHIVDLGSEEDTKCSAYNTKQSGRRRNRSAPRVPRVLSRQSSPSTSSTLVSDTLAEDSYGDEKKTSSTKNVSTVDITVSGIRLKPSVAFDTFWRVAAERQAIDDRRRAGQPAPWTDDVILRDYFFCNTYRVLDKVSQYLIKEVIEKGSQDPVEVVFRVVLFNLYTKIETWELLDRALGPLTWKTYNREMYCDVLHNAFVSGITLYTGAYIKPAPDFGFQQNYVNHLCFLESLMDNQLPSVLLGAQYLANVYEYLISFPSMGPFSTYQLMLCLSYTNVLNFHENDFVITGPGSISGLNKLFGKSIKQARKNNPNFDIDVMRYLAETQAYHFRRLGIKFSGLGPKHFPMSVADIEHTLCEVDKYCRIAHPQLKGLRINLRRTFTSPTTQTYPPAVIPKAWSNPARRIPRIRPDTTLVVQKRYEVSRIADHRERPDGTRQYLVYWVGYPPSDATWEVESSLLEDAPAAIAEYLADKKQKCQNGVVDSTSFLIRKNCYLQNAFPAI